MITVGVRELKQQASELVRKVREEKDAILITYRGRVVAKMVPMETRKPGEEPENAWATLEQLAEEIGEGWPVGVSAMEAVAEGRR
jgi:prevent-host-death family protein